MAIIVSDNFNRADSPTSLGTAPTGQTWSQVSGVSGAFGISSNTALWTWNFGDANGRVVIESGLTNAVTKVTLVNPTTGSGSFGIGEGIVFRYVDANYFWRLVYYRFIGSANQLRLQRTYAGSTSTVLDLSITLADNDTISCACCDSIFKVYVNTTLQGTYDDTGQPQNYGTLCGLTGDSGSFFATISKNFDNFLVTTNSDCTAPPPTGSGTDSKRVDAGPGNAWYVTLPVSDSGEELRSKVYKAFRATGKLTNPELRAYAYDVGESIVISDLEDGTNSTTGPIALSDTTSVAQSPRIQINCPNAVLGTIRLSGNDTGESVRDRIDELTLEQAVQGVRR